MESQGLNFWTKWHLAFMKFLRRLKGCISLGGPGMDQEEDCDIGTIETSETSTLCVETGQISCPATQDMSAAETGQMSAAGTGQMSSVATPDTSLVSNSQYTKLKSQKSELSQYHNSKSQMDGLTLNHEQCSDMGPEWSPGCQNRPP